MARLGSDHNQGGRAPRFEVIRYAKGPRRKVSCFRPSSVRLAPGFHLALARPIEVSPIVPCFPRPDSIFQFTG